jgi:transposase InsO family protein
VKRYKARKPDDEELLKEDVIRLASKYGRYGYRRITAMLRSEGWNVNHKRVERLWRELGLRVPKKQKKRGRLYLGNGSCIRLKPLYQNHVWSYDCVEDRLANGRKYKCLTIMDEFTKESLKILVERSIASRHALEALSELFLLRGIPEFIRSDNGSEFIAKAVQDFIKGVGAKTAYITPGSPWENGFIERFNGTLRDELLNREVFYTLNEARAMIENYRQEYNKIRPHSSLNYLAPESFILFTQSLPMQLVQK